MLYISGNRECHRMPRDTTGPTLPYLELHCLEFFDHSTSQHCLALALNSRSSL